MEEHLKDMTIEEKVALRKKQFDMAMAGDTRMLIWLGKQVLGQKDNPTTPMHNPIGGIHFIDDLVLPPEKWECNQEKDDE